MCLPRLSQQDPHTHTLYTHTSTHTQYPSQYGIARWKMRQKCELHKRGTLIPSEAANWCKWINHPQLAIQNTYVWANGRSPPVWGEKWMCWWAMAQIFTGQIQVCRLLHYLPVNCCVFFSSVCSSLLLSVRLSLFLFLSFSLSLSHSLIEAFAESMRDEKKTKWLLIQQPCVKALSESITLITQPKKKKKISHGVSKPNIQTFNAEIINAQAQNMDELTE